MGISDGSWGDRPEDDLLADQGLLGDDDYDPYADEHGSPNYPFAMPPDAVSATEPIPVDGMKRDRADADVHVDDRRGIQGR